MGETEGLSELISELKERAKELNCLYEIDELLNNQENSIDAICSGIVKAVPAGWQYPEICRARIIFGEKVFKAEDFKETKWKQSATVYELSQMVGEIEVYYTEEMPELDEGPFLKEERKLIDTIADRFGNQILHRNLKKVFSEKPTKKQRSEWWVIVDLLKKTDTNLLQRISRKMLNFLCWKDVEEAKVLLEGFSHTYKEFIENIQDENTPFPKFLNYDYLNLTDKILAIASNRLNESEILELIQKWIKEDRSDFLFDILENQSSSLSEISSAIEKYYNLDPSGQEISEPRLKGIIVALVRRLMSDQPQFINIAKKYVQLGEFNKIFKRITYHPDSNGKLGGKSSGVILSNQILKYNSENNELLNEVKFPKTRYITSDVLLHFINYNNLEDVLEQKYKGIEEVRQEYPYIVHLFKNSQLPPEIIKSLLIVLDELGGSPLIVRSSSLLEDRIGTVFAGKYKSLFIANQGNKEERLIALIDAILEVYASTFGPDPIEYRVDRGLEDFHEEMGILIQEVVGKKIGKYFFPSFAGVAFSNNDFRWSSRINQKDGLLRLVPGLGTRAVDRLSDDYPILISPGKPNLRVNVTLDEVIKYSPKKIDVINLETNKFETKDINEFIKEVGFEYPRIKNLLTDIDDDYQRSPSAFDLDFEKGKYVVSFEGMLTKTPLIKQIHEIMKILESKMKTPVDIEFAHNGDNLYLLQCRAQSYGENNQPAVIPMDIKNKDLLFTARRFITNGLVENISHIVYVDPNNYSALETRNDYLNIGKIVGKLNKKLPKRKFILIGPGRWGSRGDIKLGVSITYSDINNTAMLIEVARRKKDFVPDLSFGTHFFQDLVEASIKYLPLYPDDEGIIFYEDFFISSENELESLFPEYAKYSNTIKVIEVSKAMEGKSLKILMNSEIEKAVGCFYKA